jgi:hypothetical protein
MTVDLMGTIRLLHRVLGFLTELSAKDLTDIADGRRALRLELSTKERVPEQGPTTSTDPPPKVVDIPDGPAFGEIAATLRGFGDVGEGAAYLSGLRVRGKKPVKADLIKLGAEMGLTLSDNMRVADLQSRLVNHAIGARKKYAGLTKW